MALSNKYSNYPFKYLAMSGIAVGMLCLSGAGLALRGQDSNSAGGVAQGAQQGQQPTIKSDVRIVLVDVVVTGAKGAPAAGLKKGDFQISEDGRAQTVSFFEEHTGGRITPVALPAMP